MKHVKLLFTAVFTLFTVLSYGQTTQVCGQVLDPTGQCPGFEGVPIVFTNDFGVVVCETTTNSSGGYCCEIPNSQFPINICAQPNCPWPLGDSGAAGITTLDLAILQAYILGLPNPAPGSNGLYPPNFLYWADVNGDGKVTASDITLLRQYILGVIPTPPGNRCRIVPHWALNLEPSNNYYNNCNTVFEPSPFGFALGGNFNLYNIGDVNFSGQPDCNLGDFTGGGGSEAFVPPSSNFELTPVINSDNSISFFYNGTDPLAAILFSLDVIGLSGLKLSSDLKNIEIIEKDGFLHFSFLTNHKDEFLNHVELFRIGNIGKAEDIEFFNAILLDSNGSLHNIATSPINEDIKLKNTVSVRSNQSISITIDEALSDGNSIDFKIVHISGYVIKHVHMSILQKNRNIEIDNLNLESGVYILSGVTDNGKIINNKFIVVQ